MNTIPVSNCCGAEARDLYEDWGICPDCKEHCDFEEIESSPITWPQVRSSYEATFSDGTPSEVFTLSIPENIGRGSVQALYMAQEHIENITGSKPCDLKRVNLMFNMIENDALIMAMRLYGEDESSFSPECAEVMSRWRGKCQLVFKGVTK